MRAIGFRAETDGINWAVVEGTRSSPELVTYGKIPSPTAFKDEAVRLSHLRGQVVEKLETQKPNLAAIRFPEAFRQSHYDSRVRVEGVIMEACATHKVKIVSGAIVTIGSRLGSKAGKIKGYLVGDDLRGLKFPKKDPKCREAILVAVSALEP